MTLQGEPESPTAGRGSIKNIKQIEKYSRMVWSNVEMDELRKTECLCLNCEKMGATCEYSSILYHLCIVADLAMMITRCPEFSRKEVTG